MGGVVINLGSIKISILERGSERGGVKDVCVDIKIVIGASSPGHRTSCSYDLTA